MSSEHESRERRRFIRLTKNIVSSFSIISVDEPEKLRRKIDEIERKKKNKK